MGYRHTLVSSSYNVEWPEWFTLKYSERFYISTQGIATKSEMKFYDNTFFEDTQKALIDVGWFNKPWMNFVFIALSDDKVVNRVIISIDNIKFSIAYEWGDNDSLDYYSQ